MLMSSSEKPPVIKHRFFLAPLREIRIDEICSARIRSAITLSSINEIKFSNAINLPCVSILNTHRCYKMRNVVVDPLIARLCYCVNVLYLIMLLWVTQFFDSSM